MSDCKSRKERVVKEKWEEMFDKKFYMETDNGSGPECLHKVHPDGSVSFARTDHVKEFIRAIRTDGSVSGIRGMSDSREGMTPEKAREILKNHEALGHFEDIDGHGRAKGFLEGVEYARQAAKGLVEALEHIQECTDINHPTDTAELALAAYKSRTEVKP